MIKLFGTMTMDLNEKLAARRIELAIEAEKARIAEQSAINTAKEQERLESERLKKEKQDALFAEISRRSGRSTHETAAPVVEPKVMTDAEFKNTLSNAAYDRMTSWEKIFSSILSIIGIVSLFIAWPVGIVFLIWAFSYIALKESKYKAQILAEKEIWVRPRRAQ